MSTWPFIHEDFLLRTDEGQELFHKFAKPEPILDYHNHLSPKMIAENHQFSDASEMWLAGDHYKWRVMRANGVPERLITGDAPALEKFHAWAETVPHTLGNPLYHWTHLELAREFGVFKLLNGHTADEIWACTKEKMPDLRVHDVLLKNRVKALCTTDDPVDSLEYHVAVNKGSFGFQMFPTFRPDRVLEIHDPTRFRAWIELLQGVTKTVIRTLDDLLGAVKMRHDFFHEVGCRISDHGLEKAWFSPDCSPAEADRILQACLAGKVCDERDRTLFCSYMMLEFGRWDAARGWTKQLHLGAIRNTNARLRRLLGADTGVDSIGDFPQAQALAGYLNALDETDQLPKTILYNLNPADNYVFATMTGNFQDGSVAGKIQYGSGWWFLDQKEGMEWQMKALANLGVLSRFVGMVTDSRSFLSFPRHEYFRRVLCGWLGEAMAAGELPNDSETVGPMVKRICFRNAVDYLKLPLK